MNVKNGHENNEGTRNLPRNDNAERNGKTFNDHHLGGNEISAMEKGSSCGVETRSIQCSALQCLSVRARTDTKKSATFLFCSPLFVSDHLIGRFIVLLSDCHLRGLLQAPDWTPVNETRSLVFDLERLLTSGCVPCMRGCNVWDW